jgi:DNA-binding CsgD family transcriptional regulator
LGTRALEAAIGALCAAAKDDHERAAGLAQESLRNTAEGVRNVALFANAVVEFATDRYTAAITAIDACAETNDCSALMLAYRTDQRVLDVFRELTPVSQRHVVRTLTVCSDHAIANRSGIGIGRAESAAGFENLSKREREVLGLLAEGLSNREIAERLFIVESTAKLHVRRILAKTGTRSRTEAAIHARQ